MQINVVIEQKNFVGWDLQALVEIRTKNQNRKPKSSSIF